MPRASALRRPVADRLPAIKEAVGSAGPGRWALLLAGLALIVRFPFLFGRHVTPPDSDDGFFLLLSQKLLHHGAFGGQHFWTPGYPAFEALVQLAPGRAEDDVTIAQHLMGTGLVAVIVLSAWRWFGRAAAITAGTLASLTPILVVHEHTLLPDFLFGVIVFAGAVALVEATRRDQPPLKLLIAAGVAFGAATWVKPAGELLLVAAPPALLFATRNLRRALIGTGIVTAAMLLTIAPWVVRNTVQYGVVGMSDQGGRVLYYRVFDLQGLPIPTDNRHGRIASAIERQRHADPPSQRENDVHAALIRLEHMNDDSAGDAEQSLALTAIRRHPGSYLRYSGHLLGESLGRSRSFFRSSETIAELDRTHPPFPVFVTRDIWRVARVLSQAWWVLSLNALAGLLLLFQGPPARRNAAACLVSVWLALSVGTVMAHGGLWRYSTQLAAITWILGSAGAAIVVSAIAGRIRGSPPPTDSPA